MVIWLLSGWQRPFWLAVSYPICLSEGSPGPCRGQLNLDGQVTGRAGQLLWAPELQRLLVTQPGVSTATDSRGPRLSPPANLSSKQRYLVWTSLAGKFARSYCFSRNGDSRSAGPGRKQLQSSERSVSLCSLSLSHMYWLREGNSRAPSLCVAATAPSTGKRIFLSSHAGMTQFPCPWK